MCLIFEKEKKSQLPTGRAASLGHDPVSFLAIMCADALDLRGNVERF